MSGRILVAVVHPQPVTRLGYRTLVKAALPGGGTVVLEAANVASIRHATAGASDILLIGDLVSLPGPQVEELCSSDDGIVVHAVRFCAGPQELHALGADNFVVCSHVPTDDLVRNLSTVLREYGFPGESPAAEFRPSPPSPAAKRLSSRELEVCRLVALGNTTRQAARALNISTHTVDTYVARAFEKLGVNSRSAMVGRITDSVAL